MSPAVGAATHTTGIALARWGDHRVIHAFLIITHTTIRSSWGVRRAMWIAMDSIAIMVVCRCIAPDIGTRRGASIMGRVATVAVRTGIGPRMRIGINTATNIGAGMGTGIGSRYGVNCRVGFSVGRSATSTCTASAVGIGIGNRGKISSGCGDSTSIGCGRSSLDNGGGDDPSTELANGTTIYRGVALHATGMGRGMNLGRGLISSYVSDVTGCAVVGLNRSTCRCITKRGAARPKRVLPARS